MCPNPAAKKSAKRSTTALAEIRQYEPPVYKENKAGSYIEFRAFDPVEGRLKRKTIKLNHIDGLTKRRSYAKGVIVRLNEQLQQGWNPWIEGGTEALALFTSVLDQYETYIDKMYSDGNYRRETYVGYKSYVKILREYNDSSKMIYYLYQFDKKFCAKFLDYVFITRECGAQTRNNYLGFLRVLSSWLLQKGLIDHKPTDGIQPISKRLYIKERTTIPSEKLNEITVYLKKNDPYFLTACYLLYYCFIRPAEMVRLRIKDVDIKTCTITIGADQSKNHKTQTVTMPKKVLHHMLDLGLLSAPRTDYLFSTGLKPGREEIITKIFRDHWEKVRKALNLKKEWKFYSLKDSGITEMCKSDFATITVRDQARHSSLAITDIYTDKSVKANSQIIDYDGSL